MHLEQKMCEHAVCKGSSKISRQIEHSNGFAWLRPSGVTMSSILKPMVWVLKLGGLTETDCTPGLVAPGEKTLSLSANLLF